MRVLIWFAIFHAIVSLPSHTFAAEAECKPQWSHVEKRLRSNGFSAPFIRQLKAVYSPNDFLQTVELNGLLYLRKTDVHGPQVTDEAVSRTRKFIDENEAALESAEKKYHVPGAIVASLLFIETRHGENLGRFSVASVFAHLVQLDRADVISHLVVQAPRYSGRPLKKAERKDLAKRATKKVKWALSELRALEKISKKDPDFMKRTQGSFAGAFGVPQFLPSSYVVWARAEQKTDKPDLTKFGDAIHSVAFYLKDNGWKSKRKDARLKSLLRYNKSTDYASAILELASRLDKQTKPETRVPASRTTTPD